MCAAVCRPCPFALSLCPFANMVAPCVSCPLAASFCLFLRVRISFAPRQGLWRAATAELQTRTRCHLSRLRRASLVAQMVKNPPEIWETCSIPGLGRSPGGGHGNTLQYSCLEDLDRQRSLVGYSPWGHKESDITEWLSTAKAKTHCSYNKKNVAALRRETT